MAQPSLDTFNPAVSVPLKAHRSADVATGVVRPDLPRNFPDPGWRSRRALRQAWPRGAQGEKDVAAPFDAVKHTAKYGEVWEGTRTAVSATPLLGVRSKSEHASGEKEGTIEPWRSRPPTRIRTKTTASSWFSSLRLPPGGGHGAWCSWQPTRVDRPAAAFMEHSVPLPL